MLLIFQAVDVVHLDLPLQHVVQVEHALVDQIFLEPSALHAIHHIMAIQIATVRVYFLLKYVSC